jgi:hypothetical protein
MYVIFPADEIILLSYGIAQNPRLSQARPTLDRLREPLVPQSTIGTRPPPSPTSTITTPTTPNSLTPNHLSNTTQARDPSPSRVSFADDFMNKSRTSIVDESTFSKASENASTSDAAVSKKKNNKLKSKITKISLGKLGKASASNEQLEAASSSRVTEDHHVRIHNPTFTRDNLRQKNYDAFFASGEAVYSLEKKDPALLTPQSNFSDYSLPSSYANTPGTPITPPSFASLPPKLLRENSLGPPSVLKSNASKQSSSTNSSSGGGNKRPKSVEPSYRSSAAESPVKGDRCPENFVFSSVISPTVFYAV